MPGGGEPGVSDEESLPIPVPGNLLLICRVRHRFRATFSRQPRQVRKEATVTGSFVCSGAPVPGSLFACLASLPMERRASRPPNRIAAGRGRPALHRRNAFIASLDYDRASLLL